MRIKEMRMERGESQRAVSLGTGLTENTLFGLENGTLNNPTKKTLEALADYYNVSVDYILGREEVTG